VGNLIKVGQKSAKEYRGKLITILLFATTAEYVHATRLMLALFNSALSSSADNVEINEILKTGQWN
jgi:hypothetical protein